MKGFLKRIFRLQKIVDVDSWDGSASNYSTAESYAKASLMNFNTGEPDDWSKSLVKLPVRREEDSSDTFVRQAVYAAAGGRGITAVTKPDGVEEEEYNKQLKSAANQIIKAYDEMDETAPQSVYDIAGKEMPMMDQSMAFGSIYTEIYEAIYYIDDAMGTYSWIIDCYLVGDNRLFAVLSRDGKLYKQHFSIVNDELVIGDIEEIDLDDDMPMAMAQTTKVYQQKDGRYRWLCIAATTALNRNAELNSKELYDSFIRHINETGEYPILNFYHEPNTRLGIADFAARDENLYLLSGTFDDNKFGIAAAKGIEKERGYWGNSIEFWALDGHWLEIALDNGDNVSLPVYTQGINEAVSILPEKEARCLGTGIISQSRGIQDMDAKVKEGLNKLFDGDEELVEEFAQSVDSTNQQVNGMVHQSVEEDEVVETVENETVETVEEDEEEVLEAVEGVEEETIVELDERFIDELLTDLEDHDGFQQMIQALISPLQTQLKEAQSLIGKLQNQVKSLQTAQQNVERTVQEDEVQKRERWENDLPSNRVVVSYRARNQIVETEPVVNNNGSGSYADVANKTLNKILGED